MHVDDLTLSGNATFDEDIVKKIFDMFKFGSIHDEETFKLLGWNVSQEYDGITVSQDDYINHKLEFLDIPTRGRSGSSQLDEDEITLFRGHVGKMRWLGDQTRMDIAHDLLLMSIVQSTATVNDVKTVNKMVQQIKGLPLSIKYNKLEDTLVWYLTVFADASLKNLPPEKSGSAMGYLIFLSTGFVAGRRNNCCILTWKATKIKRVVKATHDAEALAVAEAVEEAIVIKEQILEMMGVSSDMIKIEVFCDSQDAVASFNSSKPTQRGSRIQIDVARVREMIEEGVLDNVNFIGTQMQLADSLTKKGAGKADLIETVKQGRFFY